MSRFFIYRPIFATVISIIIMIAGFVSFGALPVAKFPPIAPPTVSVKAIYPGGDARTIAETVATSIEQEVNGVEGMIYMSSNSANDGTYELTVTFDLGTDMDIASVLVQNRVSIAEAKLPQEVRSQGITTKKRSTQILQFIALTSPGDAYDDLFLSNYALTIKDELSRIHGVGDVTVFGAGDYSMRIWLDPEKLRQRSLATTDVLEAIREQNVQVAAGQIGAPPAPPGTAYQYTVTARGRLVTTKDFEEIIIATGRDGRALRVRDVARVELGAKDYTFDSRFDSQASSSIAIYQLPGANAMTTAQLVREKMAEMNSSNNWPKGIEYQIPFDTTLFVEASISEVYETLFIAVLLVVLVPSAFMGGITGQLFRQFSLTISGAVLISTLNALTLSPALCGILLRAPQESKFVGFRLFNAGFDGVTSAYGFVIRWFVRLVLVVLAIYVALVATTGVTFSALPTGFVPAEDQGYLFVNVQLPDSASSRRTSAVMRQLEGIFDDIPGVANNLSIGGYSLLGGYAGSNLGFAIIILEPRDQRGEPEKSLPAISAELTRRFREIQSAVVFAFEPPPIDGLGSAGGFQMELLDKGGAGYASLQATAEDLVEAGSGQSGLAGLNSTFRANAPQLFADVDRVKTKNMNVPLENVFGTLQAYLGSAYVNDFTYNNRSYQVRVQAEAEYRASAADIEDLRVRDSDRRMVPLSSIVDVKDEFGPSVVRRYNLYSSAPINGSAAPGTSSGQALNLMEQMAESRMSPGFGYAWTGMSYQEKLASGGQASVLLLAVVAVFLVLAAQYESWTSPAAVIAVVPLAALGVVLALVVRDAPNNTYTQIGIVLLVALASKNAILIVEFASEERRRGVSIGDSAVNAARLRFRAILMTAFSSILGFLPLLIASGAGAASRQAVGNAVVGGMMAATVFSLLFVPTFFVVFQNLAEWRKPKPSLAAAVETVSESPDRDKDSGLDGETLR